MTPGGTVDLSANPVILRLFCAQAARVPVTPRIQAVVWKEQQAKNFRTVFVPLAHGLASLTFFTYKMYPQLG